jgi:hypothetical protein
MHRDCTIFYQGGSGGFALYYYLLLSGKFHMSIEFTWDRIRHQFPSHLAHNPGPWKTHELWPDNWAVKKQPGSRLFLICNPLWNDDMIEVNHAISDNSHKILLYAPLELQLELAWSKQAYWFTDESRQRFAASSNEQKYIKWIKQSGVPFGGTQVDPRVPDVIKEFQPDKILRLDEFVSGPSDPDDLDCHRQTANPDQKKFLDHWINLQPKKARHLMQL